ncbi:MAG: hypothetical protein J6Q15_03450, partial [Clostridia bacterium]|nr:hypothetical protein [Clostridia bacterium]
KSISSIIEQYYKSVNNVDRKSNFISTIFNGNTNKQELFDESIKRIKDNPLMVMWCKTEGLNIEDEYDMAIINELIDLFLDYILA